MVEGIEEELQREKEYSRTQKVNWEGIPQTLGTAKPSNPLETRALKCVCWGPNRRNGAGFREHCHWIILYHDCIPSQKKNTDINSAADSYDSHTICCRWYTSVSLFASSKRAETTICVHDKWRSGRHLLLPAFCLLRHHADTKDTTRMCSDSTEHGVGARKSLWNIATSTAILAIILYCKMLAATFQEPEPFLIDSQALAGGFICERRKMPNSKWPW